ncbi:hypothetical protein DLAC_00578 [Tieghemostelium lacteum]|uniref:FNIP repeat-containing protein n=1 Tax=Tieghemostelium lacteum TaxID=361077 RepID=A0A152AA37_TIELA|nr:hypothetical protein DLAC_00578 [Tieghemostelium lacteum]|eukprot:KYR03086.1 hypothetical protein DLAC_00578 [Tieghemostelium lacteum]
MQQQLIPTNNPNVFSNIVLFLNICNKLQDDKSKLYLLSLCKSTYLFKCKVVFQQFPFDFYCHSMSMNSNIQLPHRFKSITIDKESPFLLNILSSFSFKYINYNINIQIPAGILMEPLKKLTFGELYNQPINEFTFPETVKELIFGDSFQQPISRNQLPKSLVILDLGYNNHQLLDSLPHGLEEIKFGEIFNRKIMPGEIPTTVKRLVFGYAFNQPLDPFTLPANIEYIQFGYSFNQYIQYGSLPSHLKTVIFGHNFQQPFSSNSLPNTLEYLVLPKEYQSFSNNVYPQSIKEIQYGISNLNQSNLNPIKPTIIYNNQSHFQSNYSIYKKWLPIIVGTMAMFSYTLFK